MELVLLILIAIFVITYRKNTGDNFYRFLMKEINNLYEKYAPYSFQMVREKTKELGQELYCQRICISSCSFWSYRCRYSLFIFFKYFLGYFLCCWIYSFYTIFGLFKMSENL